MKPMILSVFFLLAATIDSCLEKEPPPDPNEEMNSDLNYFTWNVLSYTENGLVRDLSILDIQIEFYRTSSLSGTTGVTEWYLVEGAQRVETIYSSDYIVSNEGQCLELENDKLNIQFEGSPSLLRIEGELEEIQVNIVAERRL